MIGFVRRRALMVGETGPTPPPTTPPNPTYFFIDQRTLQSSANMFSGHYDATTDEYLCAKGKDGNASTDTIKYIIDNSHLYVSRCDGTNVRLKQLDDSNRALFADGTSAANYIDGSNDTAEYIYDVWLKFATDIYIKTESAIPSGASSANDDYVKITISIQKPNDYTSEFNSGGWFKYSKNHLIGVYEASFKNNKFRSLSGKTSANNVTQGDSRTYARNRQGNADTIKTSCVTYDAHRVIAFLFMGWFADTNSQGLLGFPSTLYVVTGNCDSIGKACTTTPINESINCFGLENWFANRSEWLDDAYGKVSSNFASLNLYSYDNVYKRIAISGTGETTASINVSKMVFGSSPSTDNCADLIAKAYGGATNSTGYCDTNDLRSGKVCFRSGNSNTANAGVFYLNASQKRTAAFASVGTRLVLQGTDENIQIVDNF